MSIPNLHLFENSFWLRQQYLYLSLSEHFRNGEPRRLVIGVEAQFVTVPVQHCENTVAFDESQDALVEFFAVHGCLPGVECSMVDREITPLLAYSVVGKLSTPNLAQGRAKSRNFSKKKWSAVRLTTFSNSDPVAIPYDQSGGKPIDFSRGMDSL